MNHIESLKVGKNLEIETDEGVSFKAKLKKIKDRLIAVAVISGLKERNRLALGASVQLNIWGGDDLLPAIIKQNKAFPLLILTLEPKKKKLSWKEKAEEEEDIHDLVSSISDPNYINLRDSARTEDSFPFEFYKQSAERAAQKKNDYLIRPTRNRRETAQQGEILSTSSVDEKELRIRTAHLDKVLQDIIIDLYTKISPFTGGMIPKKTGKINDNDIGICVDISGTGLRFLASQKLKTGDILKVMISPLLANPPFSVSALVEVKRVSMVRNPDPPQKKFAVGVKYYAMNEEDMEQITGYTFKLQRDQLQLKRQLKSA